MEAAGVMDFRSTTIGTCTIRSYACRLWLVTQVRTLYCDARVSILSSCSYYARETVHCSIADFEG